MARSDPRIRGVALSEVLQGQVQKAVSTLIDVARGRTRSSAVGKRTNALARQALGLTKLFMIDVGEARMGSYRTRPLDNVTSSFESLCVSPPIAPSRKMCLSPPLPVRVRPLPPGDAAALPGRARPHCGLLLGLGGNRAQAGQLTDSR